MLTFKLQLDPETVERLREAAEREKRPPAWQAEVMLRRALGLPFPLPDTVHTQEGEHEYGDVRAREGRGQ